MPSIQPPQHPPRLNPTPHAGHTIARLQSFLITLISNTSTFLDDSPTRCILLISLAVIPYAILRAHAVHFIGDEVYTLRIAQQPTIRGMIALSREIDLHPPLHYFFQRAALSTSLPIWLASRVPSIIATALSLIFVFLYTARRVGNTFGLLAASILWFTPPLEFAWLNRPYALWLCLLALTALIYQRLTENRNNPWLKLAIFLAASAMVLDYMAGLACLLPFLLAETISTYRTRRLDIPTVFSLCLPCATVILYLKPVAAFAQNSFVPAYLDSFSIAGNMYADMLTISLAALAACIFVITLLTDNTPPPTKLIAKLPSSDLIVATSLFFLPLLLATIASIRHTQFFARYGACGALGFAILTPYVLLRYVTQARAVATLMALAMLIASIVQCTNADFVYFGFWRSNIPMGVPPLQLSKLDPSLPIVEANPISYTEMNDRESPEFLGRVYYLYDRDAAKQYSGSTVFENEYKIAALMNFKAHTAPLYSFLSTHHQFYLAADYENPEEWLPRKLIASGAHLQYLGKFQSTYADDDLYLVTIP